MSQIIPPSPVGSPFGSYAWADWYEKVRRAINDSTSIKWSQITDFTGSNLNSLATRNHSDLQNILPSSNPGHAPIGGTTGQALIKNSNADLDYGWGSVATGGPAFKVYMNSDQNITVGVQTKIQYDTTDYDTNSNWDGVNFRFKPTVAGKYRFVCNMVIDCSSGAGVTDWGLLGIWKNGVQTQISNLHVAAVAQVRICTVVDYTMNGSTDYVEAIGYANTGTGTTRFRGIAAGLTYNSFSGSYLHA